MIGHKFQEHLLNLCKVFQQFQESCLKFNPEKYQLFQKEVWYIGNIVSPEGATTDPKKLKAVREWPTPKHKHEIRSFLGLCTHYRQFIYGFANTAKTLTKKQAFQWTPEVEATFRTLKVALCTSPVLAYL
jgi:hypothetical protein